MTQAYASVTKWLAHGFAVFLPLFLRTYCPARLFLVLIVSTGHPLSLVTGVDFKSKRLRCREVFKGTEHDLDYDYLVIATGAQNNTFGVPGVSEV